MTVCKLNEAIEGFVEGFCRLRRAIWSLKGYTAPATSSCVPDIVTRLPNAPFPNPNSHHRNSYSLATNSTPNIHLESHSQTRALTSTKNIIPFGTIGMQPLMTDVACYVYYYQSRNKNVPRCLIRQLFSRRSNDDAQLGE